RPYEGSVHAGTQARLSRRRDSGGALCSGAQRRGTVRVGSRPPAARLGERHARRSRIADPRAVHYHASSRRAGRRRWSLRESTARGRETAVGWARPSPAPPPTVGGPAPPPAALSPAR